MHPVEQFFRQLRDIHAAGAVPETSYYGPLAALLNSIGARLKPAVRCIIHPKSKGAGIPDAALFTADQIPSGGEPSPSQSPNRGVVEAKPAGADALAVAGGEQVAKYVARYGQVLVTTQREWTLVERGEHGRCCIVESLRLAESEPAFWTLLQNPHAAAAAHGDRLIEFLQRTMLRPAPLADPADVAWLLASYAREARLRIEATDLPALATTREALEDALGITFRGEEGDHFFRSTLIQTLFYGVFSAWVLWSRGGGRGPFDWKDAGWYLNLPVIGALFDRLATRSTLQPLDLVEPLGWAGDALNRVDRAAFFARFAEEQAVQYFYEPFLEAFDPELRRKLGVWYTPPEVVRYMVARVDTVLREDLGIADGLADPDVLVLDPACGTGAYLVETLEQIATTLRAKGEGAMLGIELQKAAAERVFGFELLPAPFVVAHLQLGLLLQNLGAAPQGDGRRVGVFLTNALTGWEPPEDEQKILAFPQLQAERDAADHIKRDAKILVILGNPPYNGYPGVAIEEERELVEAYRETKRAPRPQGQGLNDLYVRFFRMAERRIVEMTGRGIVCFISNYSWLDKSSHTGMRERYLGVFDRIWIDSLNGDKYRTGKLTPEGVPDPSVFSTEWNREGIQVGTAVSLLVRTQPHGDTRTVHFRNLWGKNKRAELLESLDGNLSDEYQEVEPAAELGFPFTPTRTGADYLSWPLLPELFPFSQPGIFTARDDVVVEIDRDRLLQRMERYFDPALDHDDMRRISHRSMEGTKRFNGTQIRDYLRERGFLPDRVVRYLYRPYDVRWLYWEPETKLLDERRPAYASHVYSGNFWLAAVRQNRKSYDPPPVATLASSLHLIERGANLFPLYLAPPAHPETLFDTPGATEPQPNLSNRAAAYLAELNAEPADLFHHTVAMLHAPGYHAENAGALRQDWPRVPLPAERPRLLASAELGRQLAALLDPERPVPGVTAGEIRPELRPVAAPARVDGGQLSEADFALTAGWGYSGRSGATMPGKGRSIERPYIDEERGGILTGAAALEMSADQVFALLGETCYDVYLNDRALWRCVPTRVWEYTLGGYQVIKKWLSYREEPLLGRALKPDEVREVRNIARRIAAILLLEPALDDAYVGVKGGVGIVSR